MAIVCLYKVVISLENFVFSIIKHLITLENYLVWTIIISLYWTKH